MNGDDVRAVRFCRGQYRAAEVDDLLRRVAAELDAGRPAGPLIDNAKVRRDFLTEGYDVDAVDWFLGQFLLPQGHVALAGLSDDPWHDLPVAQLAPSVVSGVAKRYALRKRSQGASRGYFVEQCRNAWRDFGQVPGTHLWWGGAGKSKMALRTAEQQTLASTQGLLRMTFSAGGRSFTYRRASVESSSPAVAELSTRAARDDFGHFARNSGIGLIRNELRGPGRPVWELVDETGTPILYTSGRNYDWRARASIMFPDQRWLRFLVRGNKRLNAIMTAVDQAGNRIARYRIISHRSSGWDTVEITVHPDWKLTDELALAIAISAPWLEGYFQTGGG